MSWNYRIIKHDDQGEGRDYYAIHEVYYSRKGRVKAWTINNVACRGETSEELFLDLDMMSKAWRKPVLVLSDLEKNLKKRKKKRCCKERKKQ